MAKRSSYPRRDRDYYSSPEAAVLPLLPHLAPETYFVEPCAGNGCLVRHLERHGHKCLAAFDIEPQHESVSRGDALTTLWDAEDGDFCVTNPPWGRHIFHPFLVHWRQQLPTWVLHDANWLFTKQAAPFLPYVRKIVTVGRVKWIEGSKMTGKDDSVWSLHMDTPGETVFHGR